MEVLEKKVLPLEIKFLIYLVCHLDSFQFILVFSIIEFGLLSWAGYLSLVWEISARSWSIDWTGVGVGLWTWRGFPGKWDGSALFS